MKNLTPLLFLAVACAPVAPVSVATPPKALVVEAVIPSTGDAGQVVVVSGTGFKKGVQVSFGGAPVDKVTVVDANHLEVVVPPGTGTVDVCIASETGSWIALAGWSYAGAESETVAFCWAHQGN